MTNYMKYEFEVVEISRGSVSIIAPENATPEELKSLAKKAIDDGNATYGETDITIGDCIYKGE